MDMSPIKEQEAGIADINNSSIGTGELADRQVCMASSPISVVDRSIQLVAHRELRPASPSMCDLSSSQPEPLQFSHLKVPSILADRQVVKSLTQIQVVGQTGGRLASGFEFCGLHAVKNGCLAIASCALESFPLINDLFQDGEFFSKFYSAFCKPIFGDKKIGQSDVTVCEIRKIMNFMKSNLYRDPSLNAVRGAFVRNKDSLSFLTVQGGGISESPSLCFFDREDGVSTAKLVQKLKGKEPFVHVFLVGNQEFGHWYTIIVHQDENNHREYLACDSLNNYHSDVGMHSELVQMKDLIEKELGQPDQLLDRALEEDISKIERMAGRIFYSSEGGQALQEFLDSTPNLLLAEKGVHDGSLLGQTIDLCLRTFEAFHTANLLQSIELSHQLQVNALRKDIVFLIDHIAEGPDRTRLIDALEIINREQPTGYIESIFAEAKRDLEDLKYAQKHRPQMLDLAIKTFENIFTLYQEIPSIIQEPNETKRLNLINAKMGRGSAEAGFSTGKSPEEIEEMLLQKVYILLSTYQKAKKLGPEELFRFAACFSQGDHCLQNRMENLMKYSTELSGIGGVDAMEDLSVIYDLPAIAISTLIEHQLDIEGSLITENNYKQLSPAILDDPLLFDEFVSNTKLYYSESPTCNAFIDFLIREGLYTKGEEKDWRIILTRLKEHPRFNTIFARALGFVTVF